ncbi:MAG: T9SS type A sorting domain-containing protein, partial [Dolichospermum sp.]
TRSVDDLKLFGRNAVQVHNHDEEEWKDFYSQNFTPIATHFALFPILNASTRGRDDLTTNEFSITKIFPNPFTESFTLQLKNNEPQKLTLFFYNSMGQIIKSQVVENNTINSNGIQIDCQDLPSGKYIVLVKGETSGIGTQMIKL